MNVWAPHLIIKKRRMGMKERRREEREKVGEFFIIKCGVHTFRNN